MQIIARSLLFVNWIITAIIVAVIVLMVLRLIVVHGDLNPFSRLALTVRSLTDSIVAPVRRALAALRVDPKYAPLVVILLTILLGFLVLQVAQAVENSILGVLLSIQRGAVVAAIGHVLYGLLSLYELCIFTRIIFSWGGVSYSNRLMRFLVNVTEPLLAPLRRTIPPVGMMDISPLVAFFIVWLLQAAVQGTLLKG